MRNYSPNYIGLVKAAGMWDTIKQLASRIFGKSDQRSQTPNIIPNVRRDEREEINNRERNTEPRQQDTVSEAQNAQRYQHWYSDRVKEYNREKRHQERQAESIQDYKRLQQEVNALAQRDKQILDQQRAYAGQ